MAMVLREQIAQSPLRVEGQCGVAAAPVPLSPALCSPYHPLLRKHSTDTRPASSSCKCS